MREFVDFGKTLELLAVGAGIEREVVSPDVVGGPRRQRTGWLAATRRRSRLRGRPSLG